MRQVPEGGDGNFGQHTEGGSASVASDGDPTKSGYCTFDFGGIYTINWIAIDQ